MKTNLEKYTDRVKSTILNFGVIGVAATMALLFLKLDEIFHLPTLRTAWLIVLGSLVFFIGIAFRFWASMTFYGNNVKVVALKPQSVFIKKGAYRVSRNPLYVGIVGITSGAMLIAGSVSGVIASVVLLIFIDLYVRFVEEKQLEEVFSEGYRTYLKEVPRWLSWRKILMFN